MADGDRYLIPEADGLPFSLGRNVNHDPLSRGFQAATATVGPVDWHRIGPDLDQNGISGCTGWTACNCLMCLPLWHSGINLTNDDALIIYERATQLDPFPGQYPPDDTGSDGVSACKALQERGLIVSYDHAFGIDHALGALMLQPVMVGTPWYHSMFTLDANNVIQIISGNVDGGHEWLLLGYDPPSDLLKCLTPWPQFGIDGVFYIHAHGANGLERLLNENGDVTVPKVAATPPPPPPSTPPTVFATPTSGPAGTNVTVDAVGFGARSNLSIDAFGQHWAYQSDAGGRASMLLTAQGLGAQPISVSDGTLSAGTTFNITAPATPPPAPPPTALPFFSSPRVVEHIFHARKHTRALTDDRYSWYATRAEAAAFGRPCHQCEQRGWL